MYINRNKVNYQHYFGACPYCGRVDGGFNRRSAHWDYCKKCKTVWFIGNNLFSSWRDENQDIWDENTRQFTGYRVVDPLSYVEPGDDDDLNSFNDEQDMDVYLDDDVLAEIIHYFE